MTAPSHHDGRRFRNPWPNARPHGLLGLLRWVLVERLTKRRPPDPPASAFARVPPAFDSPRTAPGRLTATWVGHATFLLQIGGYNVLTDPVWSRRASPVQFAGPRRRVPPGVDFDALPPVDLVLLSHDHYDHLDDATVRRIAARFPAAVWTAPLGLASWLVRRGVRTVRELDWWDAATVISPDEPATALAAGGAQREPPRDAGRGAERDAHELTASEAASGVAGGAAWGAPPAGTIPRSPETLAPDSGGANQNPAGPVPLPRDVPAVAAARAAGQTAVRTAARVTCVPAQHFSGRSALGRNTTLWCGWALEVGGQRVLFAGDTGRHPEFTAIAECCGPFDLVLVPVGAYEPRWFMAPVHMNPEDATAAYQELCRGQPALARSPLLAAMHWGTFKLTDEPLDEPPRRLRAAWQSAGLDGARLWVPAHGETKVVAGG